MKKSYIVKLAFKNIIRARTRTILTFLILSFAVGMYIWIVCLLDGFDKESVKNLIQFDTAHFKIRSAQYDDEYPYTVSNYIGNTAVIKEALDQEEFVLAYTERIQFMAEMDNYDISTPVIVIGVNPETDSSVFTLTNYVTGEFEYGGAVLGKKLAEELNVDTGDYVNITRKNAQGMMTSYELYVSGIANTMNPSVNSATVYIQLEDAQSFLNTDMVSEIAIKTDNYNKYQQYKKDLMKIFPDHQVWSWRELGEDAFKISETKRAGTGVFILFIAIIGIVGIVNTMLMSVFEKQREIGTLKALGMKDKEVQFLFLCEGIIIGLFGALMGMVLGVLFNLYFAVVGWDLTAMMGEEMDIGWKVMGVVKSTWSIKAFLNSLIISLFAASLASYFPARRTTRMEAMECLRVNQ